MCFLFVGVFFWTSLVDHPIYHAGAACMLWPLNLQEILLAPPAFSPTESRCSHQYVHHTYVQRWRGQARSPHRSSGRRAAHAGEPPSSSPASSPPCPSASELPTCLSSPSRRPPAPLPDPPALPHTPSSPPPPPSTLPAPCAFAPRQEENLELHPREDELRYLLHHEAADRSLAHRGWSSALGHPESREDLAQSLPHCPTEDRSAPGAAAGWRSGGWEWIRRRRRSGWRGFTCVLCRRFGGERHTTDSG